MRPGEPHSNLVSLGNFRLFRSWGYSKDEARWYATFTPEQARGHGREIAERQRAQSKRGRRAR